MDCRQFADGQYYWYFIVIVLLLLLPLKEMLFREGREGVIHVVLRFASPEDVGDLYLVLPSRNVSVWN